MTTGSSNEPAAPRPAYRRLIASYVEVEDSVGGNRMRRIVSYKQIKEN